MAIRYAPQLAPSSIETHYTPPKLAARLIALVPISPDETVIDPAAGANRVFYNQFRVERRIAYEIETGADFLATPLEYDWAITNPPCHLLWQFMEKASVEARRGFAFLLNINGLNSLTPRRLQLLGQRRFALRLLHICQVRRWFGRYYFVVLQRGGVRTCSISWDERPWE